MLLRGGLTSGENDRRRAATLIGAGHGRLRRRNTVRQLPTGLWKVLTSSRTERAMRFVLPLPILMYLTYNDKIIETNFGYLMIVMYTIIAALLPPSMSAATLVWFMAVPAVVIALGLTTLVWRFDAFVADGVWTDTQADIVTLVVIGFAFTLFANFKVGSLGTLLSVGYFATVYATQMTVLQTTRVIRHGVQIKVALANAAKLKAVIEQLLPLMNAAVAAIIQTMIAQIVAAAQANQPIDLPIPSEVTRLDRAFRHAVGRSVSVTFPNETEIAVQFPGGWYLARICWEAKGKYGVIYGAVVHTLIAIGFWHLSTLIPPVRFMQTVLRDGEVMVLERVKKEVKAFADSVGATDSDEGAAAGDDFSMPAETEEEVQMPYLYRHPYLADEVVSYLRATAYTSRSRLDVTQAALNRLKGPMFLSCGDPIFLCPFGVNTVLQAPATLMELRITAFLLFFVEHHWRIVQLSFEAGDGRALLKFMKSLRLGEHATAASPDIPIGIDSPMPVQSEDESLHDAICRWTTASVELMDAIILAFTIKPQAEGAAFDRLFTTVRDSLAEKVKVVQAARIECCSGWPQAMIEALQNGKGCGSETRAWRRSFAMWTCLYLDGMITKPYRLGQCALARLKALETSTGKGAALSILGVMAPLGLLGLGLVQPWVDGYKRLRRAWCPKVSRPPVLMTLIGLEETGRASRPRTSLLRRKSEARLLFLSSQDSKQLGEVRLRGSERRATGEPVSPSGLRSLTEQDDEATSSSPTEVKAKGIGSAEVRLDLEHPQYESRENLWHILRLGIGATFLFALALLNDTWRRLTFTDLPDGGYVNVTELLGSKVAPWGCLGFLTTICLTTQATTKRALLRLSGVLLGSLSAFIALSISSRSGYFHTVWLMVFNFAAVWLGAHPQLPSISFHPSWGYAAQLFTYQQTIIIVEARMTHENGHELVAARLVGQLVGIGTALFLSLFFVPTRVNVSIREHLSAALYCLTESFAAVAEMVLADGGDTLENQERITQLRRVWAIYQMAQYKRGRQHIMQARHVETENEILSQGPRLLQTDPVLCQVCGSLDRILAFIEGARSYTQREHRGATVGHNQIRPDSDIQDLQVERQFKHVLSEVVNDIASTATLLRLVLNQGNRRRVFWKKQRLPPDFTRESLVATLEVASADNFLRLEELSSTLSLTPIKVGSEGDTNLSPPERLYVDRRSIYWTFAGMVLTELSWIGGQMAFLLPTLEKKEK